jgi:hypothetical protein
MRKQDRIAGGQQPSTPQKDRGREPSQSELRDRERVKGSASESQPQKPQRQPGRLPLPD